MARSLGFSTSTTFARRRQAFGRMDDHLSQPAQAGRQEQHRPCIEQQQLRARRRMATPTLISIDDATTLFHEFGHADPLSEL